MNPHDITLDDEIFNYIKINRFNNSKLLKEIKKNEELSHTHIKPLNFSVFQFFPNSEYLEKMAGEIRKKILNDIYNHNYPLIFDTIFNINENKEINLFDSDHFPLLHLVLKPQKNKIITDEEIIKFSNLVTNSLVPEIQENLKITKDRKSYIQKLCQSLLYLQYDEEDSGYRLSKVIANILYDSHIFIGKEIFLMSNLKEIFNKEKLVSFIKYYHPENFNDYYRKFYNDLFFNTLTAFIKEDDIFNYLNNKHQISITDIQEKIIYPVIFAQDKNSKYFYDMFKKLYSFIQIYKNTVIINNDNRPSAINLLKQLSFLIIQEKEKNTFLVNSIYSLLKEINFKPNYDEISVNMLSGMSKEYKKHSYLMLDIFYPNKKDRPQLLNNVIQNLFKRQVSNITDPSLYSLNFYEYFNIQNFNENEYYSLLNIFKDWSLSENNDIKIPFIQNELNKLLKLNLIRTETQHIKWIKENCFNPVSYITPYYYLDYLNSTNKEENNHLLALILDDSMQFNSDLSKKENFFCHFKLQNNNQHFTNNTLFPFFINNFQLMTNKFDNNKEPHIYQILCLFDKSLNEKNLMLLIEILKSDNFKINQNDKMFIKENYLSKINNKEIISLIEKKLIDTFIPYNDKFTHKKKRI